MEFEKRKAVRIKKLLVAHYSKDGRVWDISHIRDFSESGLQITTNGRFAVGELLRFHTKIPLEPFTKQELCGRVVDSSQLKTRLNKPIYEIYVTRLELIIENTQKTLLRNYVNWFLAEHSQ